MESSNVKTKESKIQFLEKILGYVKYRLRVSIDLRPSKVVAGLEPEKTCHFLQIFGILALHQDTLSLASKDEGENQNKNHHEKQAKDAKLDKDDELKHDDEESTLKESPIHGSEDDKQESTDLSVMHQNIPHETPTSPLIALVRDQDERKLHDEDVALEPSGTPGDSSVRNHEEKAPKYSSNHNHQEAKYLDDNPKPQESTIGDTSEDISHKKKRDLAEESREEDNNSIGRLFFGTDGFQDESIVDDVKLTRPKTARRAPPRNKERKQSAEKQQSAVAIKRPVIFKEDDGFFLEPKDDVPKQLL